MKRNYWKKTKNVCVEEEDKGRGSEFDGKSEKDLDRDRQIAARTVVSGVRTVV